MQVLGLVRDSNPKKGIGFAMPLAAHNLKEYLSGFALFLSQST